MDILKRGGIVCCPIKPDIFHCFLDGEIQASFSSFRAGVRGIAKKTRFCILQAPSGNGTAQRRVASNFVHVGIFVGMHKFGCDVQNTTGFVFAAMNIACGILFNRVIV